MKKLEKESLKNGERTTLWLSRIVIWVVIMVVMFPALWIIMASFSKGDRKSTRLNSSHMSESRMPSSA